jgi:hypothetical protein
MTIAAYLRVLRTIFLISFIVLSRIVVAQNIPSKYKKTVVFLSTIDGNGKVTPSGTGFFVLVADSPNLFGYLVTAKHVITNKENKMLYPGLQMRFNRRNQSFAALSVALFIDGHAKNVFTHTDTSVDLAVIPGIIDIKEADIQFSVENELFKSKMDFDTSYIKEGTNIFYTGMFSPYLGRKHNSPITRFGKVALLADENIVFDSMEPAEDLILAETTTFGGNSGSPVFAYGSDYKIDSHDPSDPINSKEQNHVPIYLLGVIKGYFGENSPIQFIAASAMIPTYSSNVGITAIVPSYFLYEILEGEELKNQRKKINHKNN